MRKLISVSELQRLDKQKGEALIMHARQYPFITEMADIDMYEAFKGYESVKLEKRDYPDERQFPVHEFASQVANGVIPCPFAKMSVTEEYNNLNIKKEKIKSDDADIFDEKLKKWFGNSDTDTE